MAAVTITALNQKEAEHIFRMQHPGVAYALSRVVPGKAAGLCKVDDYPTKGTRHWVTKYFIYEYDYKEGRADGTMKYVGMKKVEEEDSKTEAVKKARELTLANQARHTIRLVKVLEDGNNTVTDLEPKISQQTLFIFTFTV